MKIAFVAIDEDELVQVVDYLNTQINEYHHITFTGEMGSGKTTLIKTLCVYLGVKSIISSPTYSIVNEYITEKGNTIYHFDFFRINTVEEALDFGLEEYLNSGKICLMEWPDHIAALLIGKVLNINIAQANSGRDYYITEKIY